MVKVLDSLPGCWGPQPGFLPGGRPPGASGSVSGSRTQSSLPGSSGIGSPLSGPQGLTVAGAEAWGSIHTDCHCSRASSFAITYE